MRFRTRHDDIVTRTGVVAGLVAGLVSGAPSTLHALVTGRDPLAATLAAGSLCLPAETRPVRLVIAAVPVHLAISVGWGVVLAAVLPRRATAACGALAGLGMAAVDLAIPGRRTERVRALPRGPQVADHVAFGAVAGAVLADLRRRPLRLP